MLITVLIIITVLCLVISTFSFLQKGPLFSEIYYFSNENERKELKTRDWYYFIGTNFFIMAIIFGILSAESVFDLIFLPKIKIVLIVVACLYSIIRYTQLESKRMRNKK